MASTGNNFNYASLVWGVADRLRGTYKRHEYGKVILPFVVLRRLECTLEATKKEVLVKAKDLKSEDASRDFLLQKVSGYSFDNTSPINSITIKRVESTPFKLTSQFVFWISSR